MTGPLANGTMIGGRYIVNNYIAAGGMQFVYRAHDNILGRDVVLKIPKNNSAEKRFRRSAVVAAKVNHPNVAKTLDYLEENGKAYLVEELIIGNDLEKAVLNIAKYIDPYFVAKIFHHLSKGLAASHHSGVIHRDLKPTNVMVNGGLQNTGLKITDFGIAKMAEAELIEAAEGGELTINSSQTAVGALPYMAPEAIVTPKDVSKPADIWSLGAMMYELLTGTKPFGSGLLAVHKIVEANPPEFPLFIKANPQFSFLAEQLIEDILSCLQKDTASRPTADQLVERCGKLCYPNNERFFGNVKTIKFGAWGFISTDQEDVFFHFDSVYGNRPNVGDRVWFSKFHGGGAWRAHPIVCLK